MSASTLREDRLLVGRDAETAWLARAWARSVGASLRPRPGRRHAHPRRPRRGGVRALVHALRPGRRSAALVTRLHQATGGHPLHLATLLNELPVEVLLGSRPLPAPRRLAEEVRAVVAGLGPDARDVLAVLAVLGRPAGRAVVARLAAVGDEDLDRALDELAAAGLVGAQVVGARATFRLRHPLVCSAVHDGLPRTERRRRHLATAAVLGGRAALDHRVVAADGEPDEALAGDLEAAAAAEPADHRDAATRLLAAAEVSGSGASAERRLLAGALRLVEAYDTDRLAVLAPRIRGAAPGPERDVVLGFLLTLENHPDAGLHLQQALADTSAAAEVRALAGVRLALEHIFRGRGGAARDGRRRRRRAHRAHRSRRTGPRAPGARAGPGAGPVGGPRPARRRPRPGADGRSGDHGRDAPPRGRGAGRGAGTAWSRGSRGSDAGPRPSAPTAPTSTSPRRTSRPAGGTSPRPRRRSRSRGSPTATGTGRRRPRTPSRRWCRRRGATGNGPSATWPTRGGPSPRPSARRERVPWPWPRRCRRGRWATPPGPFVRWAASPRPVPAAA